MNGLPVLSEQRVKIRKWPRIRSPPTFFPGSARNFERDVFEAGLLSLDQLTNPLRLNHFATTLRELSRIVLVRVAPDADIKTCAWYSQGQGQPDVTRHQRIAQCRRSLPPHGRRFGKDSGRDCPQRAGHLFAPGTAGLGSSGIVAARWLR